MSGWALVATGTATATVVSVAWVIPDRAGRGGPAAGRPRSVGLARGRRSRRGRVRAAGTPSDGLRRRHLLGGAAILALAVVVLGVTAAIALAAAVVVGRARVVRTRRRRREAAIDRALPDLVDLFAVAAAAGLPVAACLHAVAERAPPAVVEPLASAVAQVARGTPVAAALRELGPRLGASGPVLVEALVAAQQSGSPLVPALASVAATARDARRRSAEEAARRLPVTLLFPLVCCVLPAFALLAVVPLLAASLGSLRP